MAGRPTSYKKEYCDQAYKYCLLGADDKKLAELFEVDERTINNWKRDHDDFFQSVKRGKDIADANVADRLYQRAMGYEAPDIISASYQGEITDIKQVIKHYPPDPTAAIFWLKNRQREKWRDRQDMEIAGKDGGPIQYESMTPEERAKRIAELLDK